MIPSWLLSSLARISLCVVRGTMSSSNSCDTTGDQEQSSFSTSGIGTGPSKVSGVCPLLMAGPSHQGRRSLTKPAITLRASHPYVSVVMSTPSRVLDAFVGLIAYLLVSRAYESNHFGVYGCGLL